MRIDSLQSQGGVNRAITPQRGAEHLEISAQDNQQVYGQPKAIDMTNALIMMHKAQAIVSQALDVSIKLKSIAAESMTTGKVKMDEVANEIASIDNQMGQFGVRISSPQVNEGDGDNIAKIRQEVDNLKEFTRNMDKEPESITQIQGRLEKVGSAIEAESTALEKTLLPHEILNKNPGQLASETLGLIKQNPTGALGAQGNISSGMALSLV